MRRNVQRLAWIVWAMPLQAWAQGGIGLEVKGAPVAQTPWVCNAGLRHFENSLQGSGPQVRGDRLRFRVDGDVDWKELQVASDGGSGFSEVAESANVRLAPGLEVFLGSEIYGAEYFFEICFPKQPGAGGDAYQTQIFSSDMLLGAASYPALSSLSVALQKRDGDCLGISEAPRAMNNSVVLVNWTLARSKTCRLRVLFSERAPWILSGGESPQPIPPTRPYVHQGPRLTIKVTIPDPRVPQGD